MRLEVLGLSETRVSDAGLKHLNRLPLKQLMLASTQVTDAGLADLANQSSLQVLDLGETKITDDGLSQLAGLPLIELHLERTGITYRGIVVLSQLSLPLADLHIQGSAVTVRGLRVLRGPLQSMMLGMGDSRPIPTLKSLHIDAAQLGDLEFSERAQLRCALTIETP